MKKSVLYLLIVSVVLSVFSVPVLAFTETEDAVISSREKHMLPDGSYIVEEITEMVVKNRAISVQKSGSKRKSFYSSDNVLQWTFTLQADFTVKQNISATCTNTSYTYSIEESGWALYSASTHKSGNKAFGDASFIYKAGGNSNIKDCSVTLTCDAYGNLS